MNHRQRGSITSLSFGKNKSQRVSNLKDFQSLQRYHESDSKQHDLLLSSFQMQQASFEDIFSLINQESRLFPEDTGYNKENIEKQNVERVTASEAIKQLTKKLVDAKQQKIQRNKIIVAKQQIIYGLKSEISQLRRENVQLKSKNEQLQHEIEFWRQGHERMLNQIQSIKFQQLKMSTETSKSNKLKELKQSIKEERKCQKTKSKTVNSVSKKSQIKHYRTNSKLSKDCQIQTEVVRSIIFELDTASLCESYDDNPFQGIVIQANNQLRQDLKEADDQITQLKYKVDHLGQQIKEERGLFKIQKEREFALLREKFGVFLNDYHRFRIMYSELKTENSALKKALPSQEQFAMYFTPTKYV